MGLFPKNILIFKRSSPQLQPAKQLIFLKRLHRLLLDGYPLLSALQSLKWDTKMTSTVEIVMTQLKDGRHLDEAFEDASFHEIIVSTLYFIRFDGDLVSNINQSIQVYEQHILNIKKFSQIIRYPLILIAIFLILAYFIKTSILPSFIQFFEFNASSPQSVFIFVSMINVIMNSFILFILISLICYFCWLFLQRKLVVNRQIAIISKIPFLNHFYTMKTSYQFANYFSTFLRVGMSLKDTLKQMEKQTKLSFLSYYALQLQQHLAHGIHVGEKISELKLLDKQLVDVFQESSNNKSLAQDLHSFSNILYDTYQQKLLRMMTLIQPIFFVLLACFIVLIYATLMWPMFEFIKSM